MLSLKSHSDLALLYNQFNNTSPEKNNDPTTSLTTNINLRNYAVEFTPSESSARGILLYIASHLSYKPRPDLNIYKSNQLESTSVEIINPKRK